MELKEIQQMILETNIYRVERPKKVKARQKDLYEILDYINTLEQHIEFGNEKWLKKFVKEQKEKMVLEPSKKLLKELSKDE